jgi:hypothetical protein
MQEEAERCLRDAVEHAKRRVLEVDSTLCPGLDIQQEILSVAKQIPADLLVLSTHSLSHKSRFVQDRSQGHKQSSCRVRLYQEVFDFSTGQFVHPTVHI